MYKVRFTKSVLKQLKKLDKQIALLIVAWIKKNLENCKDPRKFGKALKGDLAGSWRYRVGDCRILANIQDKEVLILVVKVGHRKDV